jgi:hypothetical protein
MHPAERLLERRPLVFTAQSAENAYLREKICAYVLRQGVVPINPFMVLGYFLYDLVEKDAVRLANNNLIMRCDELWVFGEPSDGVEVEIRLASQLGLPVRRFTLDHYGDDIRER